MLQPGLNFVIPFVDRVAYRHDLREIPLDVPSQICITADNTQLQVDGILYFQVTDPKLASYGSSNYVLAITQLAQTTLRSVIGRMELDQTFEEREQINVQRRHRARPGGGELGRQGAALRDQGPDAAGRDPALDAGADHRRAREARGDRDVGRQAAGADQRRRSARARRRSPSPKARSRPRSTTRRARRRRRCSIAEANAKAIRQIAEAIESPGGLQAVNLKVAEHYIDAFGLLARTNNTLIVPSNLSDMAGLIATAMTMSRRRSDDRRDRSPDAVMRDGRRRRATHAVQTNHTRAETDMELQGQHVHRHRRRVGPGRGDRADDRRRRRQRVSSPT